MQKHRYYFCVRIFRNIKNLSQSRKDRKGHAEKRTKEFLAEPLRPWRLGEKKKSSKRSLGKSKRRSTCVGVGFIPPSKRNSDLQPLRGCE